MVIPLILIAVRVILLIVQIFVRVLILAVRVAIQAAKVVGTQLVRLTSKALGYASRKIPELEEYAARTGEQAARNTAKYTWESAKSTARSGYSTVKEQAKQELMDIMQKQADTAQDRETSIREKYQQTVRQQKTQQQAYRNANIENARKPGYMQKHRPQMNRMQMPQAPGGGVGGILKIIVLLAVVWFIGIFVLGSLGIPVAQAWQTKLTSAMSNTGVGSAILKVTGSVEKMAGDVWHGLIVNPWEETTETEEAVSTETSSSEGMQILADDFKSPGVMFMPSQPRSNEDLSIRVGVYNPTKDFIAKDARISIENPDEIENKTGLKFASGFRWLKCNSGTGGEKCDIQQKEYAIVETTSTHTAKEIAEEDIVSTAINFEVALTYSFASTRDVYSTGPFAGTNEMPMNDFTFTIRPETTRASEIAAWENALVQRKAGGPVEVNLDNRIGLDWDSSMYLDYSIESVGPSSVMNEEVRFTEMYSTASTEDRVVLTIPKDFGLEYMDKFTCGDLDEEYYYCTADPGTSTTTGAIFTSTANVNKTIEEGKGQGFGLKLKTPVKEEGLIGKQYTISVYFLDDAYIFKGVALKDTAVKP